MPPKSRNRPPAGRYTEDSVGREIAAKLGKMERGTHAALAKHLGMSSQTLSKRLSGAGMLSISEAGAIADFLDGPPGWPFLTWSVAEAVFGRRT